MRDEDFASEGGKMNFQQDHRHPSVQYYGNGAWVVLLFLGYIFNRVVALIPLPRHARNITDLILLGFVQAWMIGVSVDPARWEYLSKKPSFFGVFFGSGFVFSFLTSLPGFDEAIDDDLGVSLGFALVIVSVVSACIGVIVWHIQHARVTIDSPRDFYLFSFIRVTLIFVLSMTYYLIHSEPTDRGFAKLHLHHYFVAWVLSLISGFNHQISTYFLATTTGIFVQGISAYSAASMFYRGDRDVPCPDHLKMPIPPVLLVGLLHAVSLLTIRTMRDNELVLAFIGMCLGMVCFNLESISTISWISDETLIYGLGIPCLMNVAYIVFLIFGNALHRMRVLRRLAKKAKAQKSK